MTLLIPKRYDTVLFQETNRLGKRILRFGKVWGVHNMQVTIDYFDSQDNLMLTMRSVREINVVMSTRRESK